MNANKPISSQATKALYDASLMPTYKTLGPVLVHGQGEHLTDADGRTYLDFTSGIGVSALGQADPDWVQAVSAQAATLAHTSNLYITAPATHLAALLTERAGMARAFFANSGAEANECAIKLARKASYDRYGEGRAEIITLIDSFHGRSLGTLAATGQAAMHPTFAPLPEGFRYVPQGDIAALEKAIGPATCAVMLEVVQGEGGVIPLAPAYLQAVEALCRAKDLLLIIDEVQTGIGRTGRLFAFEHAGLHPDVVTLAKGLGGGLPIGCCLVNERHQGVLGPGSHGSTFGGNPIVCAGAAVVLEKVGQTDFLAEVERKGARLEAGLAAIAGVAKVNRLGLMLGLVLREAKAAEVLERALEQGLLVLTAKDNLRLLPPLNVSNQAIDEAITILGEVIAAATPA